MNQKCGYCKSVNKFHAKTCPNRNKRDYGLLRKTEGYLFLLPEDMAWIDKHLDKDGNTVGIDESFLLLPNITNEQLVATGV